MLLEPSNRFTWKTKIKNFGYYKQVCITIKINLGFLDFLLDGNSLQRYFSSTQNDVESGLMLHWYIQVFEILGAYYTERSPTLTFQVNLKSILKIFNIWCI